MRNLSILIVDDYTAIRRVLAAGLQRGGHQVHVASSGEEACEILRHHGIDVVVMDLRMPTMSGQTLYHIILSQWPELRARVIVMTGDPGAADHEPWLRLYGLPVVAKPFSLPKMIAAIEAMGEEEPQEANGEF